MVAPKTSLDSQHPVSSHSPKIPGEEKKSNTEEGPQKVDTLLREILKKAKEIYPKQIRENAGKGLVNEEQGDWAEITIQDAPEPELRFARSAMVECKIKDEFKRQKEDRCSQSRAPRSTPLRPTKCWLQRFNDIEGGPTSAAEPNLQQGLINRTTHKDESSLAMRKFKSYEEIARRSLTALSQLDALKNLATVAMTRVTSDGNKKTRVWADTADPSLLHQIMEGQHNSLEYLAQMQAYLLCDTVMDRRQHTLSGSSIPREIQCNLMESDPRKKDL